MIGRTFLDAGPLEPVQSGRAANTLRASGVRIAVPPGDWKPLEETIRTVMAKIAGKRAWRARKRLRRRRPVRARRAR